MEERRNYINKYILVVSVVLILYFTLVCFWPFLYNLFISFWKINIASPNIYEKFIGILAYKIAFNSPVFHKALLNNIKYLIVFVTGSTLTALLFAGLINNTYGVSRKIYTAIFFAPVVTSAAAVSLVWKLMYYPRVGIFSVFMNGLFGISPTFLTDPKTALYWIILMDIWRSMGFYMVILIAGMNDIPKSYYESATLDGANQTQQFFRITLPLLRPQLFFITIIQSIYSMKVFVPIWQMIPEPKGGPQNSTMTLTLHLYMQTFENQKFNYGAVISIVIFLFLLTFTMIQLRFFRAKVD